MSEYPLVSIVIPTYKRTWEYLYRSVSSVISQTYRNIEVIVIDDSPDTYEKRQEIIGKMSILAETDPRVKFLVNEKNLGGSLARNRGIDAAVGQYITFLDDDDEYLPEKITHQVAFMENTKCDLSFENMIMYNPKGEIVDVREYPDIKNFDNDYLLHYHLMHHMTGTPTFMFVTDCLKQIGGFEDVKMGQEFHLMLKSIQSGLSIRYYPICDVKIYKHPDGGISSGKNKISGERALYNYKKSFFSQLMIRERMFIRFRHFAVMVVAHLRSKMYLKAFFFGIVAFVVSPLDFLQQVFGFFSRILKQKTNQSK